MSGCLDYTDVIVASVSGLVLTLGSAMLKSVKVVERIPSLSNKIICFEDEESRSI
jgi:hypothetical protein